MCVLEGGWGGRARALQRQGWLAGQCAAGMDCGLRGTLWLGRMVVWKGAREFPIHGGVQRSGRLSRRLPPLEHALAHIHRSLPRRPNALPLPSWLIVSIAKPAARPRTSSSRTAPPIGSPNRPPARSSPQPWQTTPSHCPTCRSWSPRRPSWRTSTPSCRVRGGAPASPPRGGAAAGQHRRRRCCSASSLRPAPPHEQAAPPRRC